MRWTAILMTVGTMALVGCEAWNPFAEDEPGPTVLPDDSELDDASPENPWPFRPVRMRVHPLTRVVANEATGEPVLEVRTEFFDAWGHPTKAVGAIRFELYPISAQEGVGARLAMWNIDLSDPDVNLTHFDEVTGTYLFRLELGPLEERPSQGRVEATLSVNGRRMEDEYVVSMR